VALSKKARRWTGLAVVGPILAVLGLSGYPQAPSSPPTGVADFPLTQYKLRNGLTVVISEDDSLPLVSIVVAYKAGSIYEQPGKTGLAALLENLMFAGSTDVPPLQHISFVNRVGGNLSAAGSEDRTIFYQTVPANNLALILWLEADRMRFLELDEARFSSAKAQLLDDVRIRRKSEPYYEGLAAFDQMIHPGFAFGHPPSGLEEDIRGLTLEDAKAFYAAYYAPNNAVLCLTGNIQKTRARELIQRYFETLPRGRDIAPITDPPPPPGRQAETAEFVDQAALSPAFSLGFRLSSSLSPEYHTLILLDYILLRGRSSRLSRRLLDPNQKIAYRLAGGIERRRERSSYKIFVQANPAQIEPCQNEIFAELARLRQNFLSAAELNRYKALFEQEYYRRIGTAIERALYLVDLWFIQRDLDAAPTELGRFLAVTPANIVGLAARYFTPANSFLVRMRTR
jgi:zinc protease